MATLGEYPTPVIELARVAQAAGLPAGARLFCKRDDLTSPLYGGNKVRKLEHLLDEARSRGAKRVVTVGAVGSHHVLATAIFARAAGFEVEAVLAPQPSTPHAEEVARVVASLPVTTHVVRSFAAVPLALARVLGARDRGPSYMVPPGGSSVTGSIGYAEAALELKEQIARGELPRPSCIVVALGSGGTAAGILAGLERAGLLGRDGQPPIELVAAQVVDPPLASATATLALALAVHRRMGGQTVRGSIAPMSRALHVTRAFLGRGYGHPTESGAQATAVAAADGIVLDPTYTAKAFAAALEEARRRGPGSTVLYWHTLSSPLPFERLLGRAPGLDAVDARVRQLLRVDPAAGA